MAVRAEQHEILGTGSVLTAAAKWPHVVALDRRLSERTVCNCGLETTVFAERATMFGQEQFSPSTGKLWVALALTVAAHEQFALHLAAPSGNDWFVRVGPTFRIESARRRVSSGSSENRYQTSAVYLPPDLMPELGVARS